MKVALVRPPNQGSLVRGIGFYADRLFKSLSGIPGLEIEWLNYSPNPFTYQKYDIVHFPYFDLFNLTLPPVRISRTIVTLHDVIPLKFHIHFPMGKKAKAIWPLQKKLLSSVDEIITDSEASKKDITEIIKIPSEKISVVYLAPDQEFTKITDLKRLAQVKEKYKLPDEFALYVGGVNWNKNVSTLIKACPTNLVLVGKEFTKKNINLNHIELQPLKEILELIQNNPKIQRLGFVETSDLTAVYNLAKVYVQPSIYEGFGLPLLEAMACGTPAISGVGGSLAEVAGKSVVFADVENKDKLGAAISHVLKLSPKEKDKLSQKEIDQSKKFSWEKTAKETYEVYTKVLARV